MAKTTFTEAMKLPFPDPSSFFFMLCNARVVLLCCPRNERLLDLQRSAKKIMNIMNAVWGMNKISKENSLRLFFFVLLLFLLEFRYSEKATKICPSSTKM